MTDSFSVTIVTLFLALFNLSHLLSGLVNFKGKLRCNRIIRCFLTLNDVQISGILAEDKIHECEWKWNYMLYCNEWLKIRIASL